MTTTIVTTAIMDSKPVTFAAILSKAVQQPGKPRLDRPRNLTEAETLELLKYEVQDLELLRDADDYFFLRFLRARNLNVGKAKEMLKKYCEFKQTNKYYLSVCREPYFPSDFLLSYKVPFIRTLDYDGRFVVIARAFDINAAEIFAKVGLEETMRLGHYCLEYVLYISELQRKKYGTTKLVGIADLTGLKYRNVFFPNCFKLAVHTARSVEDYYPELLQLAIAINTTWLCHTIYKIMKPFISQTTLEKVQVYGCEPEKWKPVLKKYVPEKDIPVEYGGTAPPLQFASVDIFEGFTVKE